MQIDRDLGFEDRFDHENEFRAAFPAIDDGRRVFRVRRNVTDRADERIWHAVNGHPESYRRSGSNQPAFQGRMRGL